VAGCNNAKDAAKEIGETLDQTTESLKKSEEIASQRKAFEDKAK
jgi:hypothetical protein